MSRELGDAVSEAMGVTVLPTYDALYEYDAPGSYVGSHVDTRAYPFAFHLLLEHTCGEATCESSSSPFRPDARHPAE